MNRSEATHRRLRSIALALFIEQGYDATIVNDIALAAGVSHMTFFRHFPTKEAVVLDDPYDEAIAAAVLAQERGLAALERVRRGITSAWAALPEPTELETRSRVRLIAEHEGLLARSWQNNRRTGNLIAEALISDGVDAVEARVAAAACLAAVMEALLLWGVSPPGRELGPLIGDALSYLACAPAPPVKRIQPRARGQNR